MNAFSRRISGVMDGSFWTLELTFPMKG